MTLLTIVQQTCRLVGLRVPEEVVASEDTQIQQLYALANEEGHQLARSFDWQALTAQHTFTTTADTEQPDAIPDDLDHFIENSFFNRSTRLEMIGPVSPQTWQAILAQPQLNRVYLAYRERAGEFLIQPVPDPDQEVAFEYISSYWAKSAADVPQAEFLADSDTTYLDEQLIIYGLRWRFLSAKNLDYAEAFRTYQTQVQQVQARDGSSTKINITGKNLYNLWGYPNVPLGNFPG